MPDERSRRFKEPSGAFSHVNWDVGVSFPQETHVIAVAMAEKYGEWPAVTAVAQTLNRWQETWTWAVRGKRKPQIQEQ
jgi:hypothetical protein